MRISALIFAALVVAQPIVSNAQSTMSARPSRATSIALGQATKDFDKKQVAVLQLAAHASATAQLCDGISLDDTAVEKAVGQMMVDASENVSDQERQRLHDLALVTFGTLTGLALADGSAHAEAYCAAAKADAKDPEKFIFLKLDQP